MRDAQEENKRDLGVKLGHQNYLGNALLAFRVPVQYTFDVFTMSARATFANILTDHLSAEESCANARLLNSISLLLSGLLSAPV